MSNLAERTVATEPIFDGKVIKVRVDEVVLPNGEMSKREIVNHPGAVAIIAITDEGKIVLVEQYRKALEKEIVEIPAGKLEPGEKPEVTAVRELEEETGYVCEKMEFVTSFYTSPGFADEILYVYKATRLKRKEDKAALDEDEFVELMEVSLEEAISLMKSQRIHDAKTMFAVQYLQLQK
ncbi:MULTISPECIES: NUDIX hydrolase [Bacillus cereus group]|uniref:NUDIX hydrolase n=1 Tax=Bacillus cytotoxicus TaxID=580165 RepID=A0AAX2CJX1_9BACI|nr:MULTISPECIES: NUDIX hydrolase [Bacillus cereus group]AWC33684.1 NUDIX hydrolase [Bacillus cytotoxicus]AWC37662.1 NUDIX hydrolase [Bacillus cytotoxicus]AWC61884.1 NUDIX hydrolase [Bacillus cytotoxicus]KMT51440.1 ADP-ribose pyrophosphatase [Bacillus cytotoxicus]QTR70124.1 NUDIX hydrolase [Bacillus cytotoxicus]